MHFRADGRLLPGVRSSPQPTPPLANSYVLANLSQKRDPGTPLTSPPNVGEVLTSCQAVGQLNPQHRQGYKNRVGGGLRHPHCHRPHCGRGDLYGVRAQKRERVSTPTSGKGYLPLRRRARAGRARHRHANAPRLPSHHYPFQASSGRRRLSPGEQNGAR